MKISYEDLFYGEKFVTTTKERLKELSSVLNNVDISGLDLTYGYLLNDARNTVRSVIENITPLGVGLKETISFLSSIDSNAAMLFEMLENDYMIEYGDMEFGNSNAERIENIKEWMATYKQQQTAFEQLEQQYDSQYDDFVSNLQYSDLVINPTTGKYFSPSEYRLYLMQNDPNGYYYMANQSQVEAYTQAFEQHFQTDVGMSYEEWNACKEEVAGALTQIKSEIFLMKQEEKVIPYLEMAESQDYLDYVAQKENQNVTIEVDEDKAKVGFLSYSLYINGVKQESVNPIDFCRAVESANISREYIRGTNFNAVINDNFTRNSDSFIPPDAYAALGDWAMGLFTGDSDVQHVSASQYETAMNNMFNSVYYDYLTDDQKMMCSYLYDTKGKGAVDEYLTAIEYDINMSMGQSEWNKIREQIVDENGIIDANAASYFLTTGKGVVDGIDNWAEGVRNIFDNDGMISSNQFAQMYMMQELTNSSGLYLNDVAVELVSTMSQEEMEQFCTNMYNQDGSINLDYVEQYLTDEQYQNLMKHIEADKVNGGNLGLSTGYELGMGFGNMVPSMIVSYLTKGLFTGAGVATQTAAKIAGVIGNVTMGVSAYGNAKNQALTSGNELRAARLYATFSSLSETVLGHLLGNIPGLNPSAALSLRGLFSEGLEEGLQTYVDAGLQAAFLGEDIDLTELHGEALKSGIHGAILSFVMTGGDLSVKMALNGDVVHITNINDLYQYYQLMNRADTSIEVGENGKQEFVLQSDEYIDNEMAAKIRSLFPDVEIVVENSSGEKVYVSDENLVYFDRLKQVISSSQSSSVEITEAIDNCPQELLGLLPESLIRDALDKGYMMSGFSPSIIRNDFNIIQYIVNNSNDKDVIQAALDNGGTHILVDGIKINDLEREKLKLLLSTALEKGYTLSDGTKTKYMKIICSDLELIKYIVNNSADSNTIKYVIDNVDFSKFNFDFMVFEDLICAAIDRGYMIDDKTPNRIRENYAIVSHIDAKIRMLLSQSDAEMVNEMFNSYSSEWLNLLSRDTIELAIESGLVVDKNSSDALKSNYKILEGMLRYTSDKTTFSTALNSFNLDSLSFSQLKDIVSPYFRFMRMYEINDESPEVLKICYLINQGGVIFSSFNDTLSLFDFDKLSEKQLCSVLIKLFQSGYNISSKSPARILELNNSSFIETLVRNLSSSDDINLLIEKFDFSLLSGEQVLSLIKDGKIQFSNMMNLSATNSSFFIKFQTIIYDYFSTQLGVEKERIQKCYELFGYEFFNYLENSNVLEMLKLPPDKYNIIMQIFESSLLDENKITAVYDSLIQIEFGKDHPEIISLFQSIERSLDLSDFTTANAFFDSVWSSMRKLCFLGGEDYLKKIVKINEFAEYLRDRNYTIEYFFRNSEEVLIELCRDVVSQQVDMEVLHMFSNIAIAHQRELYAADRMKVKDIDVVLPTRQPKKLLMKNMFNNMSIDQLSHLFKSIDPNYLSESQKEFLFGRKNGQNIDLLLESLKFKMNPGEYQKNTSRDIVNIVKNNLKTFNEIFNILYDNGVLNKYAPFDRSDFESYIPQKLGNFALKVLSELDLETTLLERNYIPLMDIMKKYGFLSWDSTMFDRLISKVGLCYGSDVVASLVSDFNRISLRLQRTNEKAKIKMNQYLEVASIYGVDYIKSLLFGVEDFLFLKTNPGPNTATTITGNDRIMRSLEYIPKMYNRQYLTVPAINEQISTRSGKAIKVVLGDVTSMINFTYGERTGACMRIGGVGHGLFDLGMLNSNGFHIRFEEPETGKFISRITAFRNGNTLFFNQLRESLDKNKYSDADLCEICEQLAEKIIEMTKNSSHPIDNVMIHGGYAMKSSGKDANISAISPYVGFESFFRSRGFDDSPWVDVGKTESIILATTAKDKLYADIRFGPEKADLYPVLRNAVNMYKVEEGDANQDSIKRGIAIINQLNTINQVLLGESLGSVEILEDDAVLLAITGDDWYMYVDKDGKVQIKVLDNIPDFRKQDAVSEIKKYMSYIVGGFDVAHQQEVYNMITDYISGLLGQSSGN